jgi:hypothetical protein
MLYAIDNLVKELSMPPDAKTAQVNLRLSSSLKARAEMAAAQDHRSLTSLIEKLLADHLQGRASLQSWHCRAQFRFEELLLQRGGTAAAALMPRSFRALSFAISTADGAEFKPQDLLQAVRSLPAGMRGVFLNPSLFHAYTRPELAPNFTAEADTSAEILESAVFPDVANLGDTVDFWRIAPTGFATHVRTYNEDRDDLRKQVCKNGGKWFWPYQMIRDLYELVLHGYLLAERLKSAESIEFRCEWWGLRDRKIADAEPGVHWTEGKIAREDHRVTRGEWAIDKLRHTPDVVSALAAPVLRLFDPSFDCSADWVGEQTTRFKRLG